MIIRPGLFKLRIGRGFFENKKQQIPGALVIALTVEKINKWIKSTFAFVFKNKMIRFHLSEFRCFVFFKWL